MTKDPRDVIGRSAEIKFVDFSDVLVPAKIDTGAYHSAIHATNIYVDENQVLHFRILDMGVNTAAGLIPNMKYFCYYNNDHLTETLEQQLQCLEDQCVDFVIEQSSSPYTYREIETYEHRDVIPSLQGDELCYFHYFTPKE